MKKVAQTMREMRRVGQGILDGVFYSMTSIEWALPPPLLSDSGLRLGCLCCRHVSRARVLVFREEEVFLILLHKFQKFRKMLA